MEGGDESAGCPKVFVVGLPWKATKDQVLKFFAHCNPTVIDLPLNKKGRPSGHAVIHLNTEKGAADAMKAN